MTFFFVIDTNVLLSSLILPNSTPKKAFVKAQENGAVIFSEATFAELDEVIRRVKFDKYIPFENRLLFLDSIKKTALFFEIVQNVSDCRDPKDNKFLDIALAASANYIISGDEDLLVLNPYHNIQILTPAQFLEVYV